MAINNPSIIDLCKKVDSRYTLVVAASKRARQLIDAKAQAQPQVQALVDDDELKPLKVAIEEINRGLITYTRNNVKEEN